METQTEFSPLVQTQVITDKEMLNKGLEILYKSFEHYCPLLKGIPLHFNDFSYHVQASSQLAFEEGNAYAILDPETKKILSVAINLSSEAKKKQEILFEEHEYEDPEAIKKLFGFFEKVDSKFELPNPIYLFMMGVDKDSYSKNLGTIITLEMLNHAQTKGHKSFFAECTTYRSFCILKKFGAEVVGSYAYEDYEKDANFNFKVNIKGEIFRKVCAPMNSFFKLELQEVKTYQNK